LHESDKVTRNASDHSLLVVNLPSMVTGIDARGSDI
jgi:hypothetical protein